MSTTTDLTTLKINYLTQAQYDAAVSGGTINENEIYMTPSKSIEPVERAVDNIEQDLAVLETRMDSFVNLPQGSTTGDAELIDGRVGADSVTYNNIGTAIRTQVGNVDSGVSTEIDLNDHENIALYNGYVDSSGVHYADSIRLMYVPCEGNHRYIIKRQYDDSMIFRVSSTTSSTIANNTPVSDYVNADALTELSYLTAASDKYLLVVFWRSTDTYTMEQLATTISIVDKEYGDKEYRQEKRDSKYANALKNGLYINYPSVAKRYYLDNLTWYNSSLSDALHISIPVTSGDEILVTSGEYATRIAFFEDNAALYGRTKTTVGESVVVPIGASLATSVPAGAHYLYIVAYLNGTIRLPRRLEINGEDVIKKPNTEYETVFFDDFNRESLGNQWKRIEIDPTFANTYISLFKDIDDLAYIDSGCLVLKSRLKKPTETFEMGVDRFGNARTMVCGYVSTQDSFAIKYGKISARIKTSDPFGSAHPWTFFTFGQNNYWAKAVEYDFAEDGFDILTESRVAGGKTYPAGSYQQVLWSNTHYDTNSGTEAHIPCYYIIAYAEKIGEGVWADADLYYQKGQIDTTEWHVYECEFDEHTVTYRVDGVLVNCINFADVTNTSNWDCPKDIRLNIKTSFPASTEDSMLYVDWVKVEAASKTPLTKIYQADLSMTVGGRHYVNPTFTPSDATNIAFTMESDNPTVVGCYNYLKGSDVVYHRLEAKASGTAHITITSANGNISHTFTVTVS